MGRHRHENAAFSVATGPLFLNLAEEQFVQGENILFGKSRATLERTDVVKGGGMADGLKMIAQRPPADGKTVFQNHLGFRLRERIFFQSIVL